MGKWSRWRRDTKAYRQVERACELLVRLGPPEQMLAVKALGWCRENVTSDCFPVGWLVVAVSESELYYSPPGEDQRTP